MTKIGNIINSMVEYYSGDDKRIQHFLKVYAYAKAIGELEGLEAGLQEILEVAAVTHDIGIKISEEKYNSSAGKYQELEGPPIAREMLGKLEYEHKLIDRVCYLIGHHHTYNVIDGIDYQILVEADFLVNISEEQMSGKEIENIKDKIFKTKTGISFINHIFNMD